MTASGCINYADKEPFYYFPAIISIIIGIVFYGLILKRTSSTNIEIINVLDRLLICFKLIIIR